MQPGYIQSKNSDLLSMIRLIGGFILAPLIGPCLYFLAVFVLLPSSSGIPGDSASAVFAHLLIIPLLSGLVFYVPAVLSGLVVMLLIRRYYKWNMWTSILGGLISAIIVSAGVLALSILGGFGLAVACTGFLLILKLIFVPSALAGASFWFISVRNNFGLQYILNENPEAQRI